MKVRVDAELCEGHGLCTALVPELFHVNEESGFNEMGDFVVAADKEDFVRRGVAACPERAITVLDDQA